MTGLQQIAVIIATTGLVTTLVLPGRQTSKIIGTTFTGVSKWQKAAMGRN
jgi:hypothetical protein